MPSGEVNIISYRLLDSAPCRPVRRYGLSGSVQLSALTFTLCSMRHACLRLPAGRQGRQPLCGILLRMANYFMDDL